MTENIIQLRKNLEELKSENKELREQLLVQQGVQNENYIDELLLEIELKESKSSCNQKLAL